MKVKNIAILILFNLFTVIGALASPPTNDNLANAQVVSGIQVHVSGTNVEATKEPNEPNHATNVGGKSVWFKWTVPMTRNMIITTNRSGTNIDTLLHLYGGTSMTNLVSEIYSNNIDSSTNLRSALILNASAGTTYYIAIDGYNDGTNPAAEGAFQLDIQPYFAYQGADYDTDGKTDLSLFRPSTGDWMINGTTRSVTEHWGATGDIPVVAGRSSIPGMTLFRPSDGVWYYHVPATFPDFSYEEYVPWGTSGDIPVADNFFSAISNFTVFRPSTGEWFMSGYNGASRYYRFGLQGDLPVPGQYSPDSIADLAVFRPSNGTWHFLLRSGNPDFDNYRVVKFGQTGDKPVPADYDGDGLLDIAVYRPSTGTWWILKSSNGQATTLQWGVAEDIPTTGDFDGDGRSDYAVFRPSNATWYILRSGDFQIQITQFGQTGDIPVTANKTF